jgi:hypothetical protein
MPDVKPLTCSTGYCNCLSKEAEISHLTRELAQAREALRKVAAICPWKWDRAYTDSGDYAGYEVALVLKQDIVRIVEAALTVGREGGKDV